jgi:hypothetical protein
MARFFLNELLSLDKSLRQALGVSVFIIVLQWVFMAFYAWQLPPEIPLFYSEPYGAAQLADRGYFFLLPLSTLFFTGLNVVLLQLGMRAVRMYIPLIGWLTTLYAFLASIAMVHIAVVAL